MASSKYIILGLLAVIFLAGCFGIGGSAPVQNQTNNTTVVIPPKVPSFTISEPLNQQVLTVSGDSADVTLTMNIQNLVLKKAGGAAKVGEGHFRVTIDSQAPISVTTKTYVMTALPLGQHTILVELINNDNTPYSPAISRTVSFALEQEAPAQYVPQSYNVSISDTGYDPASLSVHVGDTITFTNNARSPQSATCFLSGSQVFDTGVLAMGKSYTITADHVYSCEYYSTMFRANKGNIVVESDPTQ